jgi:hypothetical protein
MRLTFFCLLALCSALWSSACFQNPQPARSVETTPVATKAKLHPERVRRGEQSYVNLTKGLNKAGPQLMGFADPSVRLVVPLDGWNRLSKTEQVDLTYYAESLVGQVRERPATFVDIPQTAPLYYSAVKYARDICADCWLIIGGKQSSGGGLTVDSVLVQGDSAWVRDTTPDKGTKASDFRAAEK